MKSFYLTDTGRVRSHNEDSVNIVKNLNDEYLTVVADGMGGHKAGEVASSLVVNELSKRFGELSSIGTKEEAVIWLKEIIDETGIEIECFIHGAMCTNISGRCVLSNYFTNRDANRGGCCQVCRFNFNLYDKNKEKI